MGHPREWKFGCVYHFCNLVCDETVDLCSAFGSEEIGWGGWEDSREPEGFVNTCEMALGGLVLLAEFTSSQAVS